MTSLFAFTFFVWVELIGFDNAKPDFGVGEYLDRMAVKPQAVSLLLDNDGLFLSHKEGLPVDFAFPVDVASYGGRPFNRERHRQTWTAFQLKGLVAELKRHDVEVFASFFAREQYPVSPERAKVVAGKLAAFLSDYGFSGLHGSDGYAPPRYLLPECSDADRPRIARETAAKYAENWRTFVQALKPRGLKCWINTCWTRDPFEALYRYGVDYRLLAKTGIDGFIVESSAAAQSIHGWDYEDSSPIDRSMAMLMRLKACVPEMPLVLLHGINDGTEQWSALRHDPTRTSSEALALGSVFYGEKRALDGILACLGDGLTREEWTALTKTWKLAFTPAQGPIGARVVWSDRAFDREFDTCTKSRDASSNTLLCELIASGAVIGGSISVADALADVRRDGYGMVTPTMDELSLEPPQVVRQGAHYGVRLRASAPSLHLIRADVQTEVNPFVGSQSQSEELAKSLRTELESGGEHIWDTEIFGQTLGGLVRDGMNGKLQRMPEQVHGKLREAMEKIVNEGSGGMICIML